MNLSFGESASKEYFDVLNMSMVLQYLECEGDEKPSQLVHFLSQHPKNKMIV